MPIIQYLAQIVNSDENVPLVRLQRQDKPDEYPEVPVELGGNTLIKVNGTNITLSNLMTEIAEYEESGLKKFFNEKGQFEIGCHLLEQLFGHLRSEEYEELCNGDTKVDLRIITRDEEVSRLPWALLNNKERFVAATGWSVSLSASLKDWKSAELSPSPRIMIIMPEPQNYSSTNAEAHLNDLEKMLSSVNRLHTQDKSICLVKNWQEFKENIEKVKPEILYYYGHGEFNEGISQLVFSEQDKVSSAELANVLQSLGSDAPVLVYINCCLGDAGGVLGIGIQLRKIASAVITNCSKIYSSAAQIQALEIWKNILVEGLPPHEAVAAMRKKFGGLPGALSSINWITPVVHCRYHSWNFNPNPLTEDFDLRWRHTLDRIIQAGAVSLLVKTMVQDHRQQAMSFLWYGKRGQGVEQFYKRLELEIQSDYSQNTRVMKVSPDWSPQFDNFQQSVSDMLKQAFEVDDFRKISEQIRVRASRMGARQTIIYICHPPVTKEMEMYKVFQLKNYLQWLDTEFVSQLPKHVFALIGLAYIVEEPLNFRSTVENHLENVRYDNMSFRVLEELGKIKRKDLLNFFWTHKIAIPDDKLELVLRHILEITEGDYEKVVEQLIHLREVKFWDYIKDIKINTDSGIINDGNY